MSAGFVAPVASAEIFLTSGSCGDKVAALLITPCCVSKLVKGIWVQTTTPSCQSDLGREDRARQNRLDLLSILFLCISIDQVK